MWLLTRPPPRRQCRYLDQRVMGITLPHTTSYVDRFRPFWRHFCGYLPVGGAAKMVVHTLSVCISKHLYVCASVSMSMYVCVSVSISMCASVNIYTYMCASVSIYMCVCISKHIKHINKHINLCVPASICMCGLALVEYPPQTPTLSPMNPITDYAATFSFILSH
jgi:hypothetical protein